MLHADGLESRERCLIGAGIRHSVKHQRQRHIFDQREFRQQIVALEDEADSTSPHERQRIVVERCQIDPFEQHPAGRWPRDPSKHVEKRALTRPRSPGDRHELTAADRQVDTTDRDHAGSTLIARAKLLLQMLGTQD